jgi:hypothetical protein
VLEENRIAAQCRIENADRATRSNASSRIVIAITGVPRIMIRLVRSGPDKQRQAKPRHARRRIV